MTECPRCGKQNPAELHTCTPEFHRQSYLIGFADGAEKLTHWIKCSDRLPDTEEYVLTYCDNGYPKIIKDALSQTSKQWLVASSTRQPSHWMPLPSPPVYRVSDSSKNGMDPYAGTIKNVPNK
jgi:hypothetical protein